MKTFIFIFSGLVLFLCEARAQKVYDYDGNAYDTVVIGDQVWLGQNLKVAHYNNGLPIPQVIDTAAWAELGTGARCYYANDSSMYDSIYGPLYNWYAVHDTGGICPQGWHVSSNQEWIDAENFLGMSVAGGAMKEERTLHWVSPNAGATNSTGFTGLPGGMRDPLQNNFRTIRENGLWWTTTTNGSSAWSVYMWNMNTIIDHNPVPRTLGISVRCVKDVISGTNNLRNDPGIKIYPVPSEDRVTIENPGYSGNMNVQVIDLPGKVVIQKCASGNKTELSTGKISPGTYIIKILTDKGITTGKLIRK
jgi:uncharacterized protein (TIGR02145 family)